MKNTRLLYMYRDPDNFKYQADPVVLAGTMTMEDVHKANCKNPNGDNAFIPEIVGLDPGPTNETYNPDVGDYHEIVGCDPTDDKPSVEVTVEQFLAKCREMAPLRWIPKEAVDRQARRTPALAVSLFDVQKIATKTIKRPLTTRELRSLKRVHKSIIIGQLPNIIKELVNG